MGTMIHLSMGNLEIDWGKNSGFTDHSPMFQVTDVASVPSWFVADHEKDDPHWILFADYNQGYSSPLWNLVCSMPILLLSDEMIKSGIAEVLVGISNVD